MRVFFFVWIINDRQRVMAPDKKERQVLWECKMNFISRRKNSLYKQNTTVINKC